MMKLFIAAVAFIALWSSAQADQCVAFVDSCGILTDEGLCGLLGDDCKWDNDDGCTIKKAVCPDYDNMEECDADGENGNMCAWDVDGQCDEKADLVGCLINSEYLGCVFADAFSNFTGDFEALQEERACACAVSQLSCLGAADCFALIDDSLAEAGLPTLCESIITGFTTSFDGDDDQKTCNGICEQDFGYTSGNTTFAMVITLDQDIDDDKLEIIIATGIVGLEATDVTVTRTKNGGESANALQASEVEYNVDINIPAGRSMSVEGLAKIEKDLGDIENNDYIKEQTGATVTVDKEVEASVPSIGKTTTSSASGLAISALSMAFVAVLAILA